VISSWETVIRRIKENSPEIKKYFILDENRDIIVKAEIIETRQDRELESFEVIYHMKQRWNEESGGFWIPFSVVSLETGAIRQDLLFWKPLKDITGILLAFDDDFLEAWESIFDLLDQYGARVTFFVQGEYSSFFNAALDRGHDVGYHSLRHLNPQRIARELFLEESLSQVEIIRGAGVPLVSFAYPFGLSEPWMHEELLKHYKILRGYGVTFRVYDSAAVKEGYISSRALDNILFKQDEDFETVINLMFRTVKFIGGDLILPLTSHDISDSADWGIKPRRLEYLLQTAKHLQLNFYRYSDFF
jgi:peptidoglycan/xylan/chitin deacetylase (PgdA/CDA1 family)